MQLRTACLLLAFTLPVAACSSMPSWMGGTKKESSKLAGERVSVLRETSKLEPDSSLSNIAVDIPTAAPNDAWPQHGGQSDSKINSNPALGVSFEHRQSASMGDGNSFKYKLIPAPVIGGSAIFTMDARGHISAHDMKNVSEVRWISPGVAGTDDEAVMGGGLAYDNGRIYATCGRGLVAAFDAKTGMELWRQLLSTPLRAAPHVIGGRVFAVTDDSQLYALNANSGAILWSHRGVNEGTGFLIAASPAATDDIVIAPYASGEVHALRAASGDALWNDVLIAPQQQTATSVFTGIGGDPVIVDNILYVAGSVGEFAAFDVESGRRLWEQPVSSVSTPWVAGDYVYVLTTDSALVAFQRLDGRIRWVRQLPALENEKDKKSRRYIWNGPVMAGSRLLVVGAHGTLMEISPQDGSILGETSLPDGIYTPPVVAGGVLYLGTDDATLYALY